MKNVYIACAKRTAVGTFGGALSSLSPSEFGAEVVRDIVQTVGIEASDLSELMVGNILPAGQGQSIGRQVLLKSGLPEALTAFTIDMACGSGLKAVALAFATIRAGEAHAIIAGGAESMSQAPFLLPKEVRNGIKMGNIQLIDHMVFDALTDAYSHVHMGITAENIATKYSISREQQDEFAFHSQSKAAKALEKGTFQNEIVPITIPSKKESIVFSQDEYPRLSPLEKLAQLRPAFKKEGTVTAGNASGINDGAAFLLVCDEYILEKYKLKPLVQILAVGQGGVDPQIMGMGPIPAIKNALGKTTLTLQDISVIELNEAFAAQSIGVLRQLSLEYGMSYEDILAKTNVNGGAIALGHPVGASGARITVSLIHEMIRSQREFGLATLCIGGGMGVAAVLKSV